MENFNHQKIDAQHYQANSSRQRQWAVDILKEHNFSPNETVLDIGCGDGAITAQMASEVENGMMIGIDLSHEMIQLANKIYQSNNLYFKQCAANDISAFNEYSLITSFACLHWVRDLKQALSSIYRALKPNGRALFTICPLTSPYGDIFEQVANAEQFIPYYQNSIFPCRLTSIETMDTIQTLGFNIIKSEINTRIAKYDSIEAFKTYVKGWLPCMISAPANVLDDYLNQVATMMLTHYGINDKIEVPFIIMNLYLEKY